MKIAISGGSGFIGRALLDALVSNGKGEPVVLGRGSQSTTLGTLYRPTDYSVADLVEAFRTCDAVVHLASIRPIARGDHDSFSDFLPNVEIAAELYEAARIAGITNVVNASSISVYGQENEMPYREAAVPTPASSYGLSKVMTEDLAAFYNRQHGMKIKSLRIAHVLGAGVQERYMFKVFLRKALRHEDIVVWGKGLGRREYIYVKDVALAIVAALGSSGQSGVFNIGSGVNTSHAELAAAAIAACQSSSVVRFDERKQEDSSCDLMSTDKARASFDWQPRWNLAETLADTLAAMSKEAAATEELG